MQPLNLYLSRSTFSDKSDPFIAHSVLIFLEGDSVTSGRAARRTIQKDAVASGGFLDQSQALLARQM